MIKNGQKVLFEVRGKDGEIKVLEGFVGGYDPNKGLTVKALNPSECPPYLWMSGDELGNIICIDFSDPNTANQRMSAEYVKRIEDDKVLTIAFSIEMRLRYCAMDATVMTNCVFK